MIKTEIKLNKKEIRTLEKLVLKRVEEIIFDERERPSGELKVGSGITKYRPGGYRKDALVEDNSGALRRSVKQNKNFIKQNDKGGLEINLKFISYFKWLDDGRRDNLNWYFGEAIFEDEKIIEKIKELTAASIKRTIINIINEVDENI
jgi:hypothetical protein